MIGTPWKKWAYLALAALIVGACGGGDVSEPVEAAGATTVAAEEPAPRVTAPPATAAVSLAEAGAPPAAPLVLDLQEEGAVDGVVLGTPVLAAMAHFIDKLGAPEYDSGWIETCFSASYQHTFLERVVQWGSFYLYFQSTFGLTGWSYHVDPTTLEPLPGGPTPDVMVFASGEFSLGDPLSAHAADPVDPAHVQSLWYVTTRSAGTIPWVMVADEAEGPVYWVQYGNFTECRLLAGQGTDTLVSAPPKQSPALPERFFIEPADDTSLSGVPFGTDSLPALEQLISLLGRPDFVSRPLPPCGEDYSAEVLVTHARWGSLFAHFSLVQSTLHDEFIVWSYEAHFQVPPDGQPTLYDSQLATVPPPELIVMPDGSRLGDVIGADARQESAFYYGNAQDEFVAGDDTFMAWSQAADGRIFRVSVPAREVCYLSPEPNA